MESSLPIAVTHTQNKYDGFGENYKAIIITMTFAEFKGIKYLYSPFKELCNADDYKTFVPKMEYMINLNKYLEVVDENTHEKYNVCHVRKMDLLCFFDNHIDFFEKSNTLKLIKSAFKERNANPWKRELEKTHEGPYINIAIHIRRQDVYDKILFNSANDIDRLNVPSSLYVTIIKQFLEIYSNVKIHIYSQLLDNQSEFDLYRCIDEDKVVLHIDEPLNKTFTEMVYADILVMAPSSLSYTAGILSDNIIYYIPFCCANLSHWNIVEGHSCLNVYKFMVRNVDLNISYNSKTDILSTNLDDLRSKID